MFSSHTQHTPRFITLMSLLLVSISLVYAAGPIKPGMRVYDQGMKEDTRLYHVICEDGTRVSVSARFEVPEPIVDLQGNIVTDEDSRVIRRPSSVVTLRQKEYLPLEVCAHPIGKKDHCKARWDVDKAAVYACQKSKRK